jgi:hypothetical protein
MAQSMATPAPTASQPLPPRDPFDRLRAQVEARLQHFRHGPVTPRAAYTLGTCLAGRCPVFLGKIEAP